MIIRELLAVLGLEVDEQSFAMGELAAHAIEKALSLAGEALGALAAQFSEFIEDAGRFNDVAAQLGIGVERLQELRYAAELNGSSFDGMVGALTILSRNLSEASNGSEQMLENFAKAGVKLKDASGQIRPLDEVFASIADKLQSLPEGPKRVGLAMDLLGKSGAQLLPLLKDGSAGLAQFAREARELGLVVGVDTVAAADDLGDTLDRLKGFATGLRNQLIGPMIPELLRLAQGALEWAKANREVIAARVDAVLRVLGAALFVAYRAGRMLWSTLELLLVDLRLGKVAMVALAVATLAYAGNAARAGVAAIASMVRSTLALITVTTLQTDAMGVATAATRLLTLAELKAAVVGAAAPYLIAAAWGALLAVLGLIIEDVYTFFKGGDSLFGRFGKWVGKALQFSEGDSSLVRFLKWLGLLVFDTAGAFQIAGQAISGWARSFIDWIAGAFNALGARIGQALEPVSQWFNLLGTTIGNLFQGKFREAFAGAMELFQPFADAIAWVDGLIGGGLIATLDMLWQRLKEIGGGVAALLTGDFKALGRFALNELGPAANLVGQIRVGSGRGPTQSLNQLTGRDTWVGGPSQLLGQYMGRGASGPASVSTVANTLSASTSRSVVSSPTYNFSPTIQVGPGVNASEIAGTTRSQFDEWMNGQLSDGLAGLEGG